MPTVNPEVIAWARTTAGLTLEQAALKLRLKPAHGLSPVERLAALESGEARPSRTMLRTMAERYRRPLLVFYMSAPPRRGDRGEDFRSIPGDAPPTSEALLDTLVRGIRTRQAILRAALEDEEEAAPLEFVGSSTTIASVTDLTTSIRRTLNLTVEDFRRAPGVEAAFERLRVHTEHAGVYVLLIGDLGSHHSALDTSTFRGFAIADPVAPFVAINDRDAKSAWSFTLLHELVHIWLGQTGVSGGEPDQAIERFCNDVASEFLLPEADLTSTSWGDLRQTDTAVQQISDFAVACRVSRQLVAYRLYRAGRIDSQQWQRLRQVFHEAWLEERRRAREEASEREGGPSYYALRRHRLGRSLIDLVARFLTGGTITTTKAAMILGVRPKNVSRLIAEAHTAREGAPAGRT